jgi:diacylglycerol O-acyltransferase
MIVIVSDRWGCAKVAKRLSSLAAAFLALESPKAPMHVGGVALLRPVGDGFDHDSVVSLVEDRVPLVPRYRQKLRGVAGYLANPIWVDDWAFDIEYHVRRSSLPQPGSEQQLAEFCARVQSRPLDRRRPLWELYLLDGLADGRHAVVTKTHLAMLDGGNAIELAQVLVGGSPNSGPLPDDLWMPEPEPSNGRLVMDAFIELVRRPTGALAALSRGLLDSRAAAGHVVAAAGALATTTWAAARPTSSLLDAGIGDRRRFAVARTSLSDYQAIRAQFAAGIHDVVLATITGALRAWLLSRSAPIRPDTTVRALVPMSLGAGEPPGPIAGRESPLLLDLPVGEPSPLARLSQLSHATRQSAQTVGPSVGAWTLVALAGLAPPTLHALGALAAQRLGRRTFDLLVTDAPSPQRPRWVAGARLEEIFPVMPLPSGQAVAIGVTSYDGGMYYGLHADHDAMTDLDTLATQIEGNLAELVVLAEATRPALRGTR